MPACLLLLWQQAGGRRDGTYFDPSTSDGSFAAGHTNTYTQHNTALIGRGVVRLSGGVRLLFVLGTLIYLILWPVIGTSEAIA
ncbi:MAG: hypothetical protein ACYCY2_09860 [Acidithiobacillus ferriphilus]